MDRSNEMQTQTRATDATPRRRAAPSARLSLKCLLVAALFACCAASLQLEKGKYYMMLIFLVLLGELDDAHGVERPNSTPARLEDNTFGTYTQHNECPNEMYKHYKYNIDRYYPHLSDLSWGQPRPARLRHSRHSNQSPREAALGSTNSKLSIKNNQKPVFSNCSSYHPSMDEEKEPNQLVFTVKAEDKDPPENGGTITYQFVSAPGEKNKFTINPETGEIFTLHKFDRDEPAREKETYISVRATDNGIPQLDDVCTIKITIDDINDNTPVFDKVSYSESIPQDLEVGSIAMRISATDIDDGNNSRVEYSLNSRSKDQDYFRIDPNSGLIHLAKAIDKPLTYRFNLGALVTDKGEPPNTNSIELDIRIVDSNKKAPTFIVRPTEPIYLKENFNDFQHNVAVLQAVSNIPEDELIFELVPGKTEQTNKMNTFILESDKDMAYIKLGNQLDYEKITGYILKVRVQNKYNLAAETLINIEIEDVNDNIPVFIELRAGIVLENQDPGTPVMQVRAIDLDGTSAHNIVSFELADHHDMFAIDSVTGNITTLVQFDREDKDFYNVKVIATDNSPSALFPTSNKHNSGQQVFRIEIADENDNPPHFTKDLYIAEAISELANINEIVTEVQAHDKDSASQIQFTIVDGNLEDAFIIEETTGKIRVQKKLDYETTTEYTLRVRAFDGIYEDFSKVIIKIDNVNDNPPRFVNTEPIEIVEEKIIPGCIVTVEAWDPDIRNRSAPQRIVYSLVKEEQRKLMSIDKDGCIKLIKPLDRDQPMGYSTWQVIVQARDENGSPNGLPSTTEVIIHLIDINDNAPFLTNPQPVYWPENTPPGFITNLTAKDYDSDKNGPPFKFAFDESASMDIRTKFGLKGIYGEQLHALTVFDREEIKEYILPIAITDSGNPPMTGVSYLRVVIQDKNDNAMQEGHSNIFVYNFEGELKDTEIGRIYVNDPDDWDLADKKFYWLPSYSEKNPFFEIQTETGMITIRENVPPGTYPLRFNVTEESLPLIPFHWVEATVNVTVKDIPEEAVIKSGSIRFINVTAEEFIEVRREPERTYEEQPPLINQGLSQKDILRQQLSLILNTSLDNIDVFTVYNNNHLNESFLDVRFSAHGSPYYFPEKMNTLVSDKQDELEELLGHKIQMINIDECIIEKVHCEDSCRNILDISRVPLSVFTNKTSFVGVSAKVVPKCTCQLDEPTICLNGGTPIDNRCECPDGLTGPRCEITSVGFHGDGWALYPPLSSCNESRISVTITPSRDTGLIFYAGPLRKNQNLVVQDFMSLQLENGYLVLLVNYGSGTTMIKHKHAQINDNQPHYVEIILMKTGIEMFVDNCRMSSCMNLAAPIGQSEFLNVNGPLQIGGASVNLQNLGNDFNWGHIPIDAGFVGCISNFTFNFETYNLGAPGFSKNMDTNCQSSMAKAVSFGIDTNFLVALLVCIGILLLLLLAVVVHRRRSEGWPEKEFDDIRENIINYEDEGGGEGDAAYDLHVLRTNYDPPEKERDKHQMLVPTMTDNLNMHGDISNFLDEKKNGIDRDPDTNPFDDVRHYAYEGDGNTTGSLSSLASCTDEGDLKFNYLSSFGPRFRKLADMYGEVPSDEDESQAPGEESWC